MKENKDVENKEENVDKEVFFLFGFAVGIWVMIFGIPLLEKYTNFTL